MYAITGYLYKNDQRYLACTLFSNDRDYTTEELCDVSANSHDFIHETIEKYFRTESKEF